MLARFLIVALTFCFCNSYAHKIYFSSGLDSILEVSQPQYLITKKGYRNFSEIRELEFGTNEEEFIRILKLRNSSREFWVKLSIKYKSKPSREIYMKTSRLSYVDVFQINSFEIDSSSVGLKELNTVYTSESDQSLVELLPPGSGDELTLYIRFSTTTGIAPPNRFWLHLGYLDELEASYSRYRNGRDLENYFQAFFCGLMLFQLIYVLVQWYLVRKSEYGYYAAYILSVFIYFYARFSVFNATEESFALIGASTMILVNSPLLILPSFFYFRFTRYFVDLQTRDKKLNKHIKVFEWFLLACFLGVILLHNIPNDYNKSLPVTVALISQIPFAVYVLVRIAHQRRPIAYFLIVASSFALLSHLLANFLPVIYPEIYDVILPLQITMLGVLAEVGIFNTGLLFKARESETQKVAAQAALLTESSERRKLQDEYYQVRDKISSDLHDDLGSSLSSIQIYGYAARQRLEENNKPQTLKLLSNIEKTSRTMLNSMSDIVWAINPSNDSNYRLVDRIQAFGFEILSARGSTFKVDIHEKFYGYTLNQAQRRNILLISKEAINNAAKYAGSNEVIFKVRKSGKGFDLTVSDDGKGIQEINEEGNGLRTMKKRAKELSDFFKIHSDSKGTTISFHV
mgnify:CR=1 FL=1